MKILAQMYRDVRGVTAVEFALVAPTFLVMVLALFQCGLLLWTQVALQHGAEMAARCATTNTLICGTSSDIQKFAVKNAYGLSLPTSTFTPSTPVCGNQVSATYQVRFITGYFGAPPLTLSARSCFPK